MVYDIQAEKDIKLSSVVHALGKPAPFIKTENRLSRNLEDIRVRRCIAIRNMIRLIFAVSYFASIYPRDNPKLKMPTEMACLVSKKFSEVPGFSNYAIADSLPGLLFSDKTGIRWIARAKKPDFQLCFDFWEKAG
jgi:hypothetical protein